MYMDDLKLFTPNTEKLAELKLVKQHSDDIQMEFGLNKCAKCTFVLTKSTKTDNKKIDLDTTMQDLDNGASYKYLGVEEDHQMSQTNAQNNCQRILV